MCGITGVYCFNKKAESYKDQIEKSIRSLKTRGPDANDIFIDKNIGLGHTRLSIIDITEAGTQPFTDNSGRYTLIFNGEFYNYNDYKNELLNDGIIFRSTSDTEILLYLLIKYGTKALESVNGCFAFAFYDSEENTCLIARDRMGINPLHYYQDNEKIIFASEMKGVLSYDIPKKLNYSTLKTYLQLNYIPTNQSILENVHKLEPGTFMLIDKNGIKQNKYYEIPKPCEANESFTYSEAKTKLHELMNNAVQRRMIADVPLGCFLSGGIDSSIITALASNHTKNLNTFSIGFSDNPFFDETNFAEIIAKKYNTNHTVFKVSNDELLHNLDTILDYFDEPFADSSSLAVYILSQLTRKKATVALSGDGADELFSGYNKHSAHFNASYAGAKEKLVSALNPLWKIAPKSRNSKNSNFLRQLNRFSTGFNLSADERYWFWASIGTEKYADKLLKTKSNTTEYYSKKKLYLKDDLDFSDLNTILYTDLHLVLQGDMLTKTDLMSMANSLEVRTPFLDHTVIDFVAKLPASYKIDKFTKKKILKETFKDLLPVELLQRHKHGFEVPILEWFRNELWSKIDNDLLKDSFILEQDIFNLEEIRNLKEQLQSNNPEDSAAKIWALLVFQNWWKKYFID
jgi:asparagine synthase (glutamine-hydrolysing)